MRILFNKTSTGAQELKEITGSYYANNDFKKIHSEIHEKTENIIKLIGSEVYALAEDYYYEGPVEGASELLPELLRRIQLAVAYGAAFDFFRMNIVSHEDSGRKLKLGTNDKMPWEWMLDRDDEIHQRKANVAIDRLIEFLDSTDLEEWEGSEAQKATKELFVDNTALFDRIYSIDGSGYFFHLLKPIMAEVQRTQIMPALGVVKYRELLEFHQNSDNSDNSAIDPDDELLLVLTQQAIPLLTMILAVERLSLSVMPYGLVQKFKSERQGRDASIIAPEEAIRKFSLKLERSATRAFDVMKKQLNASFNYDDYPLLPENNEDQKYFRT